MDEQSRVPADPYGVGSTPPRPTSAAPSRANPYRGPSVYRETRVRPMQNEPQTLDRPCPPGSDCGGLFEDSPTSVDGLPRLAAVRASPFIQMSTGSFHLRERISSAIAFGGEVGLFAWERLRASARAVVPITRVHDEISKPSDMPDASAWLWGFSVGAAANRQDGFAMSPSVQFLHISGGDFGSTLGLQVPFEWLTQGGFRVGFDFSLLYGFGGHYRRSDCAQVAPCPTEHDRPNSAGFFANFLIGHVFEMPGEASSP